MEEKYKPTDMPRHLYLRLSETECCFARYELQTEPLFAFASFQLKPQTSMAINLREAAEKEPLLMAPATTTHLLVGGHTTLVPLADFQEEECAAIYHSIFPTNTPQRVFYDTVPMVNAVLLFAMDEQLCATIESIFHAVVYHSIFTSVLRHFSKKNATNPSGKRIYVYGHESGIEVMAFEEGRLMMYNSFPATVVSDVSYYVMNVAHHLGASPETTTFYVAGNQNRRTLIAEELQKFAHQVNTLNPTAEYNRHVVSTNDHVPYDMMTLLAN